jgi:hypothetical protein
MTDTPADLRAALRDFYAAEDVAGFLSSPEGWADDALRKLGEAVFYVLSGQDMMDPADDPAAEAARQRVLAIIGAVVPVPSAAEMEARQKEVEATRKRVRKEARAARRSRLNDV